MDLQWSSLFPLQYCCYIVNYFWSFLFFGLVLFVQLSASHLGQQLLHYKWCTAAVASHRVACITTMANFLVKHISFIKSQDLFWSLLLSVHPFVVYMSCGMCVTLLSHLWAYFRLAIFVPWKSTFNILLGIKLPSLPVYILYTHIIDVWLHFDFCFAIVTYLTLWMVKIFSLTTSVFCWHHCLFCILFFFFCQLFCNFLCQPLFSPACSHICELSQCD